MYAHVSIMMEIYNSKRHISHSCYIVCVVRWHYIHTKIHTTDQLTGNTGNTGNTGSKAFPMSAFPTFYEGLSLNCYYA